MGEGHRFRPKYISLNYFQHAILEQRLHEDNDPYHKTTSEPRDPAVLAVARMNLRKVEEYSWRDIGEHGSIPGEVVAVIEEAQRSRGIGFQPITSEHMRPPYFEAGRLILTTMAYQVHQLSLSNEAPLVKVLKTAALASYLEHDYAPDWSRHFLLHFARIGFPSLFINDVSLTREEINLSEALYLHFKVSLHRHLQVQITNLSHFIYDYCVHLLLNSYLELQQLATKRVTAYARRRNIQTYSLSPGMEKVWQELGNDI